MSEHAVMAGTQLATLITITIIRRTSNLPPWLNIAKARISNIWILVMKLLVLLHLLLGRSALALVVHILLKAAVACFRFALDPVDQQRPHMTN